MATFMAQCALLAVVLAGCGQMVSASSPQEPTAARSGTSAGGPSGQRQSAAGLIFFDDFEYEVNRDEIRERPAFIPVGKWTAVKAINTGGRGAGGYLYTVDRIPGYRGKFPGRNSQRVLAIEARPGTFQTQTDFYLQFGNPRGPADQIPGNVWFQFWIYVNFYDDPADREDQPSGFDRRDKFIYPSVDGNYPTWPVWLFCLGPVGQVRLKGQQKAFWVDLPTHDLMPMLITGSRDSQRNFVAYAQMEGSPPWDYFKLGQDTLEEHIKANRWTLVKLHIDTSTSSGKYEAWLKPLGGREVKVAEWIDGVTPGFSWKIPPDKVGGYKVFRMPTTIGNFGERAKFNRDAWIYVDDFAMATSDEALPRYGE